MLADEVLDNPDLAREVILDSGPVPEDFDAHFLARLYRAGVDRLPEDVGLAFGNDGDARLRISIACRIGE
jgi:hypothetical protein